MKKLHYQHRTNITWSTIETLFFQGLLLIHQYALFKITDAYFYGLMGALFGSLYLCIKILDLGANKIITSFFLDYSPSKITTRTFLIQQHIPTFILYITIVAAFVGMRHRIPLHIDTSVIIIVMLLVLTETIKASTKKIIQLLQRFRLVAFFEIALIIGYKIIIWSYYYCYQTLTLPVIFGSFLLVSTLETFCLLVYAYQWYKELPETDDRAPINIFFIMRNRISAYSHSMSKQLFSANILVPLFAYSFGLESAALLKWASYLTHSITAMIEKIVDPASAVLFAHIKNDSHENKQYFFSCASSVLHTLLICLFIFMAVNGSKLIQVLNTTNITILLCMAAYFSIHFIETFFIVIEKFYIAHNKSEFLLINTFFNTLLAVMIFMYSISPHVILLCLFTSRIVSFCASLLILSLFWQIKHTITVKPFYIIGATIASIVFFIIF